MNENNIRWLMLDPLEEAKIKIPNENGNFMITSVPDDLWKKKMLIEKGDRVTLFYSKNEPIYTFPIQGNTVWDFFRAIEVGTNTPFTDNDKKFVEDFIKDCFDGYEYDDLTRKYKNGVLCPRDFCPENNALFVGNISKKGNIWIYSIDLS